MNWDDKKPVQKVMVTLPKRNFYGVLGMWTLSGLLVGYLIGDFLHALSMMC